MKEHAGSDFESRIDRYLGRLEDTGVSFETRRNYASRVRGFLLFLKAEETSAEVLEDPHAFKSALVRYQSVLQHELLSSPGSINNRLTAILHFARFLGLGYIHLDRLEYEIPVPRTLASPAVQQFVNAIETCPRSRDRCIALLILLAGLRLGECAQLDVSDFSNACTSLAVNKRSGCHGQSRQIALEGQVLTAVRQWADERKTIARAGSVEDAFFVNSQGKRLSTAGINFILRSIGRSAGLVVSAQVLRNTYVNRLMATRKESWLLWNWQAIGGSTLPGVTLSTIGWLPRDRQL